MKNKNKKISLILSNFNQIYLFDFKYYLKQILYN